MNPGVASHPVHSVVVDLDVAGASAVGLSSIVAAFMPPGHAPPTPTRHVEDEVSDALQDLDVNSRDLKSLGFRAPACSMSG